MRKRRITDDNCSPPWSVGYGVPQNRNQRKRLCVVFAPPTFGVGIIVPQCPIAYPKRRQARTVALPKTRTFGSKILERSHLTVPYTATNI